MLCLLIYGCHKLITLMKPKQVVVWQLCRSSINSAYKLLRRKFVDLIRCCAFYFGGFKKWAFLGSIYGQCHTDVFGGFPYAIPC